MTGLVLLHGWGYGGQQTWSAWTGALGDAPVVVLDTGYFGPRNLALPANPDGWIGVGHSLGFARLLGMDAPWRGLVGIGGFLRFCATPDKPVGTPPDMLDTMISRLATAPEDVLARFHRRCGHRPTAPTSPVLATEGLARLRDDLLLLRGLDLRPPVCRPELPVLFIQAQDDRIVPPDLAREAQDLVPGAQLELLADGGHALPMTRAGQCLRLVQEFVHGLG